MSRLRLAFAGALLGATLAAAAQTTRAPASPPAPAAAALPGEQPLPQIDALMREVEANERKSEALERNYLYEQRNTFEQRDSGGKVKKTETREEEVFWLNGVQVVRTLKKDGKDLAPDELKKENERIDAEVKKARERRDKADAGDKETDSHGRDEITFARILELGAFSNERRETVNGRPTIVVDYLGDPRAKTRNYAEGAFRELAGTVWVDEQDKTVQHLEAHFDNDFKVGAGLVASVKKGTWGKATFSKINDEVWLPQTFEGDGQARYLLFLSLNGHFVGRISGYRKFKATSTILPGLNKVEPNAVPPVPGG